MKTRTFNISNYIIKQSIIDLVNNNQKVTKQSIIDNVNTRIAHLIEYGNCEVTLFSTDYIFELEEVLSEEQIKTVNELYQKFKN